MRLNAIRRLNIFTTALFVAGLLTVFGGIAVAVVINSTSVFAASFTAGFVALVAVLLLSFAIDRVRCPNCGKPFNRPDYGSWLGRNLSKTQPRWSCAHCAHGKKDA